MDLSLQFPKKRAFITGAGSGLGRALALTLAPDGWRLGLSDIDGTSLDETVALVQEAGGTAQPFVFDVADASAFEKTATAFLEWSGGVDLVINNAGVGGGGLVGDYSLEDWEWLIGINLMGVVHGCHYFVPHLKTQGHGHVINVASAAGFVPVPRMAAYCSAKAGVKSLSEVLHGELYEHGVGVSVAMPEFFQTNIHERTRGPETHQAQFMVTNSPYTAEEVARFILDGAAKGRLHLVFGKEANILWRLVRYVPNTALRMIRRRTAQRRERAEAALAAQQHAAPADAADKP